MKLMKTATVMMVIVALAATSFGQSNNITDFRTTGSGYGGAGAWSYFAGGGNGPAAETGPVVAPDECLYRSDRNIWNRYDYGNNDSSISSTGYVDARNDMALAYTFSQSGTIDLSGYINRNWSDTHAFMLVTSDDLSDGYDGSYSYQFFNDTLGDNGGATPQWNFSNYEVSVQAGDSLVMEWAWESRHGWWWEAGGTADMTVDELGMQIGLLGDDGSTNNIADFDGVTNEVSGGRWSYLQGDIDSGFGIMTQQFTAHGYTGDDNWTADQNNGNNVWVLDDTGGVRTDSRDMIWNYTVDSGEASEVNIAGTIAGGGDSRLRIYQTADPDMQIVDASNMTLLYDATAGSHTFDLNTIAAGGDDIMFVMDNQTYWWLTQTLDATITVVPEPASMVLLALGGLVAIRRKK